MKRICASLGVGLIIALAGLTQTGASSAAEATPLNKLLRADGSVITYYLDRYDHPRRSEKLLLVIQGSDCNSVRRIPAIPEHLAGVIPEADVLTVEKYGIDENLPYEDEVDRADCPRDYLRHDSLSQRARDLDAVLTQVLRMNFYRQVVVIGGSEGAVVAHMLSAISPYVSATIAFNGGGQWFIDDVLHSVSADPMSARQKEHAEAGILDFVRQVRSQGCDDLIASDHGCLWWREVLSLDQLSLLKKTTAPALIIQSGRDKAVSPSAVLELVARLHMSGSRNIYYRTYPELDHRLSDLDGTSRMHEVASDMALWLGKVLGE